MSKEFLECWTQKMCKNYSSFWCFDHWKLLWSKWCCINHNNCHSEILKTYEEWKILMDYIIKIIEKIKSLISLSEAEDLSEDHSYAIDHYFNVIIKKFIYILSLTVYKWLFTILMYLISISIFCYIYRSLLRLVQLLKTIEILKKKWTVIYYQLELFNKDLRSSQFYYDITDMVHHIKFVSLILKCTFKLLTLNFYE